MTMQVTAQISVLSLLALLRLTVGALLAILSLLTCRARAVGAGDILLFLGFGLHLVVVLLRTAAATAKLDALHQDLFEIVHCRKGC